jgi:hypothetical protein
MAGGDVYYASARAGQIDENSRNLPNSSATGQKICIKVLSTRFHGTVRLISAFTFVSHIEFIEWYQISLQKTSLFYSKLWPFVLIIIKSFILLYVHPLLGNIFVNKFPRRQILGKQTVVKLRNNRKSYVLHVRGDVTTVVG